MVVLPVIKQAHAQGVGARTRLFGIYIISISHTTFHLGLQCGAFQPLLQDMPVPALLRHARTASRMYHVACFEGKSAVCVRGGCGRDKMRMLHVAEGW